MRYAINPQLQIGETLVSDIQFDIHSREIFLNCSAVYNTSTTPLQHLYNTSTTPLQHFYNDTKARDAILEQLGSVIIAETDPDTGRPGMSLWSILVLGVLRLGLNCDYDRVMGLANEHRTLREMLGHGLFDKGFHSKSNQEALQELLDKLTLPKKGKWSKADKERESTEAFVTARKQHPAIESSINALEVHGLDRCPDRGINGFKRYVAWSIVGRKLIKLGAILQQKEREQLQRAQQREYRQVA